MKIYIGKTSRSLVLSSENYNLQFDRLYKLPGGANTAAGGAQQQFLRTPTVSIRSITSEALQNGSVYGELHKTGFHGLLGLVTVHNTIYVAVVSKAQKVGFPRWKLENDKITPLESIYKVLDVEFISLETNEYDSLHIDSNEQSRDRLLQEHPCGSLKKLFSDGTFYFSRDFDLSNAVKNHSMTTNLEFTIENQDLAFIWNANLTSDIVSWRSRISAGEKHLLDNAGFLTFVIRGYCKTTVVNDSEQGGDLSSITLISRISTERKQNSFELEGITDDGRISNFIETEVVITTERFIFSYTQIAGNIPLFWEAVDGQLLSNKKVKFTKDKEQTQLAFDRHFDNLESKYGVISVVNIVKPRSESQDNLARLYMECAQNRGVKITNFPTSTSSLSKAPHKLLYMLRQDIFEFGAFAYDAIKRVYFGKQTGVMRISAFDSIVKICLTEKFISHEVIELATKELHEFRMSSNFMDSHDKLWLDNSYWLESRYSKNVKSFGKYTKVYNSIFTSKVKLYDPLHFYIAQHLKQKRSIYTFEKEITIFAGTFNVSGKMKTDDISDWLFPKNSGLEDPADLYLIGLEEVVELTPGHMLATDPYVRQFWEKKIHKSINNAGKKRFMKLWSSQLGGVILYMFINENEYSRVKHIDGDVKKTGFGGITSNKGAVAVSFRYSATKFCAIASHLAAGLENVEQRHNDYKTIVKNIRFSGGLKIKDHDAILWMGDFNYRILMPNEEVRRLIVEKEYSELFKRDQLNEQMIAGGSFPYYHEFPINFPPTYKFDPETKTYDTSEKMRIPAWTDRILSRGELLKQISYGCCEDIIFSDHRPVYATFNARVTIVDEQKKTDLFSQVYEKILEKLGDMNDDEKLFALEDGSAVLSSLDDENLIKSGDNNTTSFEARKGRKLPPPSSDQKKWWIGNGKQVKVILDVDADEYMINPKRNPNPFIDDSETPLFVHR